MADRQEHRSSKEIRRDIEGTRKELRKTVDAIERKLSVGQIADEVWGRVGGRGPAGTAASNVGDAFRDHPVPLALIGLGVAWLVVDKATRSEDEVGQGTNGHTNGGVDHDETGQDSWPSSSLGEAKHLASDAAATVKEKASAMAGRALGSSDNGETRERDSSASPSISDRVGEAADRAREVAGQAQEGAGRGVRRATHGIRSAWEDQPLALGAVAFGLGLASGLAAPTTRWEDKTMGRTADVLKEEVGTALKDVAEDVKQVVGSAASAANDEAGRQGGEMKDSVKSIASEAKEAAKEEMRRRDLDAEGVKGRAEESLERTEDRLSR